MIVATHNTFYAISYLKAFQFRLYTILGKSLK